MPLVSILIPAYNASEWIAETLRSAIGQTWQRKEIIVVNDGSKDDTLSIARQFESRNVLIVNQENQGAAATRNKAFSLSQGDYVQWLDADDVLALDKIERQMDVAERCSRRTLLSGSFARFLYRRNRAKFCPTALWETLSPAEWLFRKMALDLHMQTGNWLVSRELTERAGPWNTELLGDDDGEYFCRVLLQSEQVQFVPKARAYYRVSGTSSLSYIGQSDRKRDAQWRSMLLHIQYMRSLEESPRTREACVKYLQNWLVFFYPQRMDLVAKASDLAAELGGRLELPRLSWKYSWIQALVGVDTATRAQFYLRSVRWRFTSRVEKACWRMENWLGTSF
jgi:glycosyltransferase involved in cell wall biosynthesis